MPGVRIVFVFLLLCGLVALESASARPGNASRAGWISAKGCEARHTNPGRADCLQKCWREGASAGHPEWKPQRANSMAMRVGQSGLSKILTQLPISPPRSSVAQHAGCRSIRAKAGWL
jgi:hypothetical protein